MQIIKILISFKNFILQSNIFISLCSLALSIETSIVVDQPFKSIAYYSFVFFSTLFAYNFYYFKSNQFSYYKVFTLIGIVGVITSYFYLDEIPMKTLVIIGALSSLYIIPVFISFNPPKYYSVFRLLILISVWVLFTFLLPINHYGFNTSFILLIAHRSLLMSILCVFFFIKDEKHIVIRKKAFVFVKVLLVILFINVILIFLNGNSSLALIYSLITSLLVILYHQIKSKSRKSFYYLFYVDGIMILQTIFVLIKFLF